MKNLWKYICLCIFIIFTVSGCGVIGSKTASMSVIYGVITICSCIVLSVYCVSVQKKDLWMVLLFLAIVIVNAGYLALSISKTLEEALLANRIAYLGAVVLPMSMLMLIMNVCEIRYKKIIPLLLSGIALFVFLVAASPGYLDIYYKEVTVDIVNGACVLNKVYGSWHSLYLIYLLSFFGTIIVIIGYASHRKKLFSNLYACILAGVSILNISVWLMEQCVRMDFEFLSVSYLLSEFFLLSVSLIMQEQKIEKSKLTHEKQPQEEDEEKAFRESEKDTTTQNEEKEISEEQKQFLKYIEQLTATEKKVFNLYLEEKTTKEILEILHITENTLKYHNKNIYSKLGIASRKELIHMAKELGINAKDRKPL